MSSSITICEIFEAFTSQNKSELKMEKIKEYVYKKHGNSFEGITIKQGYKGNSVFISPRRAYYHLDKSSKEFSDYEKGKLVC